MVVGCFRIQLNAAERMGDDDGSVVVGIFPQVVFADLQLDSKIRITLHGCIDRVPHTIGIDQIAHTDPDADDGRVLSGGGIHRSVFRE